MSNTQHMVVRILAVAVLMALHWFPHTHAAPIAAATPVQPSQTALIQAPDHADSEPVSIATTP